MSAAVAGLGGFNERSAVRQCTVDDLELDRVAEFVRAQFGDTAESEVYARRLGLTARVGQHIHPTPVGLLCFGDLPQLVFPQWGLSCVRIAGRAVSDPVAASADLEGPIDVLVEGALRFVIEQTRTIDPGTATAVDTTQSEYSVEALRELIVNAVVHRDLKLTGRAAVQIFDDRIIVRSPGGPLFDAQSFDMLANVGGRSIPRNPLLASVARRLSLCEQIGRGLTRARRLCSERTRAPLRIEASRSEVRVVVPSALGGHLAS